MNTFLPWLFEIRSISSLVDKGSSSAILYIPDGILSLFINSFISRTLKYKNSYSALIIELMYSHK